MRNETLILTGVAVLGTAGLVYVLTRPKATPSPAPGPDTANQLLIAEAQRVLAQVALNPVLMDEVYMDQLADKLGAAGQADLAKRVRDAAAFVRASKNSGPAPVPTRAALLAKAQVLLTQAATSPMTTNPAELDALGEQLSAIGETETANRLHNTAALIRVLRGVTAPTANVGGVVTQPPRPTLALIGAYMTNPATNPSDVDRLANALAARGFASHVARLRARSAELRAARRSGGYAFR